jgi:hypothetical protein
MTQRISVRRDDELSDALAVLAAAGLSVSDAVRVAVRLLADAHQGAYDSGLVAVGQAIQVVACTVEPAPDAVHEAAA